MSKKLFCLAMLALCFCGWARGADEPVVPPPPTPDVQPIPDSEEAAEPAVPTVPAPVPDSTAAPVSQQPQPIWLQDYGYYWYRPEAVVPGTNAGLHPRYPYYSYRRPWYPAGPASVNVTIIW